jgi:hypothetical protein
MNLLNPVSECSSTGIVRNEEICAFNGVIMTYSRVQIHVNIPAETRTIISQVLFLTTDFNASVCNEKYKRKSPNRAKARSKYQQRSKRITELKYSK